MNEKGLRTSRTFQLSGSVSSEPEDNNLGYNVTMRSEGDEDKFTIVNESGGEPTIAGLRSWGACCPAGMTPPRAQMTLRYACNRL